MRHFAPLAMSSLIALTAPLYGCAEDETESGAMARSSGETTSDAGTQAAPPADAQSSEPAAPRVALVIRNISEPGVLEGRGDGAVDIAFSPGVWISHSEQILLPSGEPADEVVEELAEQGKTRKLRVSMGDLGARGSGLIGPEVDGDYAGGLVAPGEGVSAAFDVELDEIVMFAAMFTQSNDTMLGFDEDGVSLGRLWEAEDGIVDVSDELRWWNAGTEVNEPPGEGESQAECEPEKCDGEPESGTLAPFTTLSAEGEAYPEPSSVAQVWLVNCETGPDAGPSCSP